METIEKLQETIEELEYQLETARATIEDLKIDLNAEEKDAENYKDKLESLPDEPEIDVIYPSFADLLTAVKLNRSLLQDEELFLKVIEAAADFVEEVDKCRL